MRLVKVDIDAGTPSQPDHLVPRWFNPLQVIDVYPDYGGTRVRLRGLDTPLRVFLPDGADPEEHAEALAITIEAAANDTPMTPAQASSVLFGTPR